jgi:hypothetical protein
LTSWVNTEYSVHTSDFSSNTDGWQGYGGSVQANVDGISGRDDCLQFTSSLDSSNSFHFSNQSLFGSKIGTKQRVTLEVYLPSTNTVMDEIEVRQSLNLITPTLGTNKTSVTDQWVTLSFEFVVSNHRLDVSTNSNGSSYYQGNGTDTFYVRNIQVDQLTADGRVTTWYDQGGTNHATQATASNQPKIVDAGVLVTEGGQAALDFDGTNDALEMGAIGVSGGVDRATYAVVSPDRYLNSGGGYLGVVSGGNVGQLYDHCIEANQFALRVRGNALYTDTSDKLVQNLWATNFAGTESNDIEVFKNGSQITRTGGTNQTINTYDDWIIGETPQQSNGTFYDGTIQEIVIYDSDQSANRTFIENNINSHFTIYS